MSKELKAFRKICKNLNSYEFTDEYKENKKLIEKALEHKEKSEKAEKSEKTEKSDKADKSEKADKKEKK